MATTEYSILYHSTGTNCKRNTLCIFQQHISVFSCQLLKHASKIEIIIAMLVIMITYNLLLQGALFICLVNYSSQTSTS